MRTQLAALRKRMEETGIDAYLVPTADFHGSEYVDDYFKCREYVSGFTGSAGTLIVLKEEAGLWTDGRYYLQAEQQLAGSGIELYRDGMPGVPSAAEFIRDKLGEGAVLGFDGRVVDAAAGQVLAKIMKEKQGKLSFEGDLVGDIWPDRPAMHKRPAYLLDLKYTGKSSQEKQKELREKMKEAGADRFILTSPDDIAWLFNMRGNDVEDNPVVMAYLMMTEKDSFLYVNPESFGTYITNGLECVGVTLRPYEQIYEDVKMISPDETVMLEKKRINYRLLRSIPAGTRLYNTTNPTTLAKAVKTPEEVQWAKDVHVMDGVAVTRFLRWLKENVGKTPITEISAAEKLDEFRRQNKEYKGPSFSTIVGYREHGAVIHYQATEETNTELKPEGMVLIDSGGQYLGGTTDVTRTVVLGPISEEEKIHYTMTVKAMLRLAEARFLKGCRGENLDILAREVYWKEGLDYRHGTGHGVGSFLNVHERPNSFQWKHSVIGPEWAFEPGMITSDEPGYYEDGKYGIRIENLLLCQEVQQTEYGTFLGFEPLTWVPIDKGGLDLKQMSDEDIQRLNRYHSQVWAKLEPFLDLEEKGWLLGQTCPILKDKKKYQVASMSGHFFRPMATEPEYFEKDEE
jgi:Xaa-Pro aminopeptidase